MKKIFIFSIIIISFFSFISASEQAGIFSGGTGQYLISQTSGNIQNSPFRYEEKPGIKVFGITGKITEGIQPKMYWIIIPLILLIAGGVFFILKKKKNKKNQNFKDGGGKWE